MKIRFNIRLTATISAVMMLTGMASANASDLQLSATQPTEVLIKNRVSGNMYIVQLADPAIAAYEGGFVGYAATSAKATGKKRLNTKSRSARKYEKRLKHKQRQLLNKAKKEFGRTLQVKKKKMFHHAFNGFAVALTVAEAKALAKMPGVKSVHQERVEYPLTDVGPNWIGAAEIWNARKRATQGEGMVIAVLDTGINPDHPAFAATGGDGYSHSNPLGSGNHLPGSYCDTTDASFCNDKLIAAWSFVEEAVTPNDSDGHGSHTASTAAGNVQIGANLQAPTTSISYDISGVAPHANIIAYDVCFEGCPSSALLAAVNQVVIDSGNLPNGIAALNFSISGGNDPYNNPVELAFKNAVEAGIYVAAAGGNDGPATGTVNHSGPWVSTTAASTHNRQIRNSVVNLDSSGGTTPDIVGLGATVGFGPAPIINSADLEDDFPGSTLCGTGTAGAGNTSPWPAGTFNGEIVVCSRGTYGRVEKGSNVLFAGAGGYILIDNGSGLVADAHVLPGVHISQADGVTLTAWLAANADNNPIASISGFSINLSASNGDVMAGFSSRGPGGAAIDVLKPDVTAPGVSILGATADGQAPAPEYKFSSGTSMSSPHNAGAAALMKARHPDWTPQEIKSAIMMTAVTENTFKEDGLTPTDPFDLGAGRIALEAADNSQLVMSESIENFDAANPALGGDPRSLNLASMMHSNCVGTCSWNRTLTNKSNKNGRWFVTGSGDGFDVLVDLPKRKSKILKIPKGQSATIRITAVNYNSEAGFHFGKVTLSPVKKSKSPELHIPIAVRTSTASKPELFTKTVDNETALRKDILTYELSVNNGQIAGPITVTDVIPQGTRFVRGSESESVVRGSTSSQWSFNPYTNRLTWTGKLDVGGLSIARDPGGSVSQGYFSLSNFTTPLDLTCNNDCDDGGFFFNVPAFTYRGQTYTQTLFSVNGTIEVGAASRRFSTAANQNLPDTTEPNNILAPFWRDLNLDEGGNMYVAVLTTNCGSATAYEWENIPHFGSPSETVTMQVWIGNDGGCLEGVIHYVYGDMSSGTDKGGTVGAENADGTVGTSYFFNGSGIAPTLNEELLISTLGGGSATFGFKVKARCKRDLVINEATVTGDGANEKAIAVTECL